VISYKTSSGHDGFGIRRSLDVLGNRFFADIIFGLFYACFTVV
jgi:hypothetical protein